MFLFALSLSSGLFFLSSLLFKLLVVAFIAVSAAMTVGVPVVYTTVEEYGSVRRLVEIGAYAWVALLILVTIGTFLVI